ncbi:MAG TPA: transporter substrate-binding domain-containing protein [Chloroflexaceae bacterium]|nr:transporter substrate-binding domain-containing protein [Chloroflexaceae bacterium]
MRRLRLPWFGPMLGLLLAAGLLAACGAAPPTGSGAATAVVGTAEAVAPTAAAVATDVAPTVAAAATQVAGGATTAGDDLLADVRSRGTLRVSTDSNYAPQSFLNPSGEWEGFDIEVAREIASRLGVEAEFLDISFDVITAGSWNGRWDVNVGSMTVTGPRQEVLIFTTPYYYTPAAFAVHSDSDVSDIAGLEGARVGVGAATTYLDYLNGSLELEGETIESPAPAGATAQVYDTDLLALQDLSLGDGTRLDAVLTALPTVENAIQNGEPFKVVGDPVYYEALAVALDRSSALDSQSLADEITRIVEEMRADGTLTRLSEQFYGVDIATKR